MKKTQILNQWAVVTGASTGIGYEYCKLLLAKGYHILGVSRKAQGILALKKDYPNLQIKAYDLDLSNLENVYKLYNLTKNLNVTLLINNAGYGVWGKFVDTDLDTELNMLTLNIDALHILTKLFTKRFVKYNYGRVINIASMASFQPGPGFSSYYASKAYVLNLSIAANYELRRAKSKVRIIAICPGPLKTNFWQRSKIDDKERVYKSGIPVMANDVFAEKSLNKAMKVRKKNYIIIGFWNKLTRFVLRIISKNAALKFIYKYQVNR
ncbi:MAG: SDR family NAD(P)-dependent oxidoreductase [Spiroplasma sp.]|nr:SDR family NAD(P)-dependent oxidoreductase [Spiroplasma sp.]